MYQKAKCSLFRPKQAQRELTFLQTLLTRIPKKGAATKAQTRIHGAVETPQENRAAQRGRKQSQVQEPPQADESAVSL